ncbi:helix-turn-helix domain-containing protein [Chryseobacterium populi]|uniref:DNA-binding domain-containing protein, AraC-type n=1 Tax=Chryseobacterium populi TaxID=1144316 RepID=J2JVA2_9FLAO|nr:AraC family transcriptional regulator [Chryseobacterium populi]EJL71805.1 DNA-binding domain-containing protein, AraC-type [Chryseobacterium populi]
MAIRETNINAEIVFTCSGATLKNTELIAEEHSVVRIISGELKVIQYNKTYVFGKGETLLFPRNQLSTLIKTDKDGLPYRAIVVKLSQDVLRNYYEQKNLNPNLVAKTDNIIPLARSPLLNSFFASMLPYFDLNYQLPEDISQLKIQEAIAILRSIDKQIDNTLSDFSEPHKINLVEFMERNFMFNMPIEKFGYLTGRSLTTFKRDFKKAFNNTPQKWLTEKRLERAYYQLTKEHKKPIDIYYEVGFENLSHFSFAFKKQFGYAPKELIAQREGR